MGSLAPKIVVVFVNRPLIIQGTDWPAQMTEKGSRIYTQPIEKASQNMKKLISQGITLFVSRMQTFGNDRSMNNLIISDTYYNMTYL